MLQTQAPLPRTSVPQTKHGVLCKDGLLTIQANGWQVVPMVRSGDIVNLMQTGLDYGLTHLWVHADTGVDPEIPLEVKHGCFQSKDFEGWNLLGHTIGKHVKSVYGWPLPKGMQ